MRSAEIEVGVTRTPFLSVHMVLCIFSRHVCVHIRTYIHMLVLVNLSTCPVCGYVESLNVQPIVFSKNLLSGFCVLQYIVVYIVLVLLLY